MNRSGRSWLVLALLAAACGEDVIVVPDNTTGDGGDTPCIGEPCSSNEECRAKTAGSFCGTVPDGEVALPVCFVPCDPSAAVPFCDGCKPFKPVCDSPCEGYCDPAPFTCEG